MSENPADNDFHAFPTSSVDGFTQHGMMARDYFAAVALQGLGTWMPMGFTHLNTAEDHMARAKWAYDQADAMLAARSHSPTPQTENKQERETGR